jgi:hypothetical protein
MKKLLVLVFVMVIATTICLSQNVTKSIKASTAYTTSAKYDTTSLLDWSEYDSIQLMVKIDSGTIFLSGLKSDGTIYTDSLFIDSVVYHSGLSKIQTINWDKISNKIKAVTMAKFQICKKGYQSAYAGHYSVVAKLYKGKMSTPTYASLKTTKAYTSASTYDSSAIVNWSGYDSVQHVGVLTDSAKLYVYFRPSDGTYIGDTVLVDSVFNVSTTSTGFVRGTFWKQIILALGYEPNGGRFIYKFQNPTLFSAASGRFRTYLKKYIK